MGQRDKGETKTNPKLSLLKDKKNIFLIYCFICTGVLPAYVSVRVLDVLELELQRVMSCHVAPEN